MALSFAHGAIQWLAADAATTVYTVSGLSFQPKAIHFYWQGLGSATDTTSTTTSNRAGHGLACGTSDRRCVAVYDRDNGSAEGTAAAMVCSSIYRDDAVVATLTSAPATDGLLDLNSITSDGFTLIVDDQAPADITVFWEAWGGSDVTVNVTGAIAEPAATGDVDYTVTGFTSGATDQVVFFAGVQSVSAANTAERQDSGLCYGIASSGSVGNNIVILMNNDDGSANADTDVYALDGECLAMITVAGGNPNARATLTQFGTDNFRLNWIARGLTNRRYIFMAIKGGSWAAGSTTIDVQSASNTATVSGLSFAPVGVSLMTVIDAENTAGTSASHAQTHLGTGSSTSSRRAMGSLSLDGAASGDISLAIEYDQIIVSGVANVRLDLNAMNSDGFQLIVDTADAGEPNNAWVGYLTFGDAPAAGTRSLRLPGMMMRGVGA